ncbi:hypothetical protein [Pseudorhodoplanes sp.]|uniref:hypothetical protein n=1 Tax=Pseudorhodoplanes sp. TaxID=1934341 RepID=UPI002B7A78BC|nr:hypothetical protein [Pseudorhodoplanes sp.]HWK68816.1 hypothetical protein [Rhizobiaceae bacterium]HWV40913.1 hypothetical protein [Pseudorhodoplanes sp.]
MAAADRQASAGTIAWANDWSGWYSQYLRATAGAAERTQDLYQRVMERIARGELEPNALQDMLTAFYRQRGHALNEKLSQLTLQFFADLVRNVTAYSNELTQVLIPGTAPVPSPPELTSPDPAIWFQQITDYSTQLSAHIARSYRTLSERMAAGQLGSDQIQKTAAEHLERRLPDYLSQLGASYFELLNGLNDLRAQSEQEFLSGVLATASRTKADSFAIELVAALGSTANASFSISNTRDVPAVIRCEVADARRSDGVGPAFVPNIMREPNEFELAPGQEARVTLALPLDEAIYAPEAQYVGALHVVSGGEPHVEIPLRIMATRGAPPVL